MRDTERRALSTGFGPSVVEWKIVCFGGDGRKDAVERIHRFYGLPRSTHGMNTSFFNSLFSIF